jgi:stage III sporulation protein AC
VPDVNLDFYNQKKPKPDIIPVNIQDKHVGLSVVVDNSNNNGKDNSSVNANSQNMMMNSRRGLNTSRTGSNLTNNMLIKSGRDEQATLVTVAGLILTMIIISGEIKDLFTLLKSFFG